LRLSNCIQEHVDILESSYFRFLMHTIYKLILNDYTMQIKKKTLPKERLT